MPDGHIQKMSKKIFDAYPDMITTDFELNKEILSEIAEISTKRMRNKIAGRLVVMKRNKDRIITSPNKGRQERRNKKEKR